MARELGSKHCLLTTCCVVVGLLSGCSEKAATTDAPALQAACSDSSSSAAGSNTATIRSNSNSGDTLGLTGTCTTTTGGNGGGTTGTTGGTSGTFDLCANGLQTNAGLANFATLVNDLCGSSGKAGTLPTLRQTSNIYEGGTPNYTKTQEQDQPTAAQLRLYTTTAYPIDISDYWNLVQLQFVKPTAYKANFAVDPNANMQSVVPATGSSSYRYSNDDGSGGAVDYNATTTFLTLQSGQAYVAATMETHENETMKALVALIVINKRADGKTEAFTISDQTYEFSSGQGDAVQSRALQSAGEEQTRGWQNAPSAGKAAALLNGG